MFQNSFLTNRSSNKKIQISKRSKEFFTEVHKINIFVLLNHLTLLKIDKFMHSISYIHDVIGIPTSTTRIYFEIVSYIVAE